MLKFKMDVNPIEVCQVNLLYGGKQKLYNFKRQMSDNLPGMPSRPGIL